MTRTNGNLEEMASGKLGRLFVKYSWPALVAMTLNALYAVVDRVFIGQGCGVDAMAGLQLAMPVMMLFGAFGVFVGAGHAAVLSIKLGENDFVACEKIVGELIAMKLAFFFVLPPLVFFNLDTVLGWCGADKVTPGAFIAAKSYLQIVIFSHVFSHIAFGLSALQRAEGSALRSMLCMVVGFGANLVLDPIMIFGLGMGIEGAAWATNIAMFLSCVWAARYYLTGRTVVIFRWWRIGFYRELLVKSASIGVAPFLQQLMSSVIVMSLQLAFTKWMPDEAARTAEIASLGVFNGALILVFMPMLGCQQGLQPIFGYNWGAKNYHRVLGALKLGFVVTTVLTIFAFVIQVVPPFPSWIARMFVSAENPEIIRLAAHDLMISNSMIWCISVNVLATTYFQSIGKPAISIALSMLRQGVILLPIVWFLPYFLDDKPLAIWLSMPVSDVLCNLATIPPLLLHIRHLRKIAPRCRGLCLMSGGLDSQLAVRVLESAGAAVEAVAFVTPFFDNAKAEKAAAALGVKLHLIDFLEDEIELIENPPHGFGGAMNPCIDCHARMIRRAGELMTKLGYDFVATGEVRGQRPMSQNAQSLVTVEKASGLKGRLVRPLSAKLLEPTIPELEGMLNRERLLDISGRSRDRQIALAAKFGITDYPSPAGGCKLTEAAFGRRLKDLMDHEGLRMANGEIDRSSIELLQRGRRFRLPDGSGVILGRDAQDNGLIKSLAGIVLKPENGVPGPTALIPSLKSAADLELARGIVRAWSRGTTEADRAIYKPYQLT